MKRYTLADLLSLASKLLAPLVAAWRAEFPPTVQPVALDAPEIAVSEPDCIIVEKPEAEPLYAKMGPGKRQRYVPADSTTPDGPRFRRTMKGKAVRYVPADRAAKVRTEQVRQPVER